MPEATIGLRTPAVGASGRAPALPPSRRPFHSRIRLWASMPFWLLNLSPILIVVVGVSWPAIALLAATLWIRMFFITAGYHRYFAHRTYRLRRFPQFLLALGGTTAVQKGPLWWAAHHRDHHLYADTERDVHSPQGGFWWSHMLWILCDEHAETKTERIKDFAAFPELRFLDRHNWIGPAALAVLCLAVGGWRGLVFGFLTSTVLLWHATFCINSMAHVFGRRRYATSDTSRNSFLLAVLTMGEGWHNNHHHHPSSCRNGFFWWEWDPTFYGITVLRWLRIVSDVKVVPPAVRRANRVDEGNFDVGMFRCNWRRAMELVHSVRTDRPAPAPGDASRDEPEPPSSPSEAVARREVVRLTECVNAALAGADDLARVNRREQRREVVATE